VMLYQLSYAPKTGDTSRGATSFGTWGAGPLC
jgi:hypothetical protein